MPHTGQAPGLSLKTSGSIGQIYSVGAAGAGRVISETGRQTSQLSVLLVCGAGVEPDSGAAASIGFKYRSGSAANRSAQDLAQK
jgi:hypothetical protein